MINVENFCSESSQRSSAAGFLQLKKARDAEMLTCMQMAINDSVSALESQPERDLLIQDFMTFECLNFPAKGQAPGTLTSLVEFKFFNHAPIAFKYFRGLFQIDKKNFLRSVCSKELRQLECAGASGAIFYLTHDDEFILKTIQQREGDFLLKLLPAYYLNLTQNPQTLLPKFYGYYCYGSGIKSIRIVVMNNLIPSNVIISQKYDLKGSTSRRKATPMELRKPFPTFKDLDFIEHYPEGLLLDADTYAAFAKTLQRDCRVLESFKIIDYSLLLAIHYVDEPVVTQNTAGIPARTATGKKLLLFMGIIDILQSYQLRKKVEHAFKSIVYKKDSVSVHRPDFYSQRFQNFIIHTVFQPMPKKRITKMSGKLDSNPCCSNAMLNSREKKLRMNRETLSFVDNDKVKPASKQTISDRRVWKNADIRSDKNKTLDSGGERPPPTYMQKGDKELLRVHW